MKQKEKILFISARPQFLISKILKILKQDFEIYLYSMNKNFNKKEFEKVTDKVIVSNFMGQNLLKKKKITAPFFIIKFLRDFINLKKINPDIIIAEGEPNWSCALAKLYFRNKRFIYFPYDITYFANEVRKKISKIEKISEKFCFETADIIIHKGPENELKLLPYKIKGKKIQF
ncbi:MAG: hypothetical protein Q8N88_05545, partial [Nanoarchaeota archaeon]|nr:hypothetical protein [Nanoarchaeota archaeon]